MLVEKTLNFIQSEVKESKKGNIYQVVNFLDNGETVRAIFYGEEEIKLNQFEKVTVKIKVVLGKYSRLELVEVL